MAQSETSKRLKKMLRMAENLEALSAKLGQLLYLLWVMWLASRLGTRSALMTHDWVNRLDMSWYQCQRSGSEEDEQGGH